MRLEIDAGNTFLKWRLMDAQRLVESNSILTKDFKAQSMASLATYAVQQILVGSVAGVENNHQVQAACISLWGIDPIFAKTSNNCAGVKNSYLDASKMGVDRWLAMIAAYKKVNRSVIVVDCGSAITVDYVSAKGVHQGGYIIPGLRLMRESLLRNTAQVRFDQDHTGMAMRPGVNTTEAVMHGCSYLFQSLAHSLKDEADAETELFITGGDGELMHSMMASGLFEPDLVMEGLVWVCR
ncbi:type III pantothenate kinase [Neptunomonas antarctica]|uniref:Type III pantothenate kinase n=2 Tax=Neptunomonas antarctica TaxID=619304 RepID=A0A1N7MIU4_9GAMM|nr:type III pantothenate kinase [Neptunomonas antarctica]